MQDTEVCYTLIGHSEGRSKYGEIDEDTEAKVENCQAAGLKVLCIAELLEEREAAKTVEVNKRQLAAVIPEIKNWDDMSLRMRSTGSHCGPLVLAGHPGR